MVKYIDEKGLKRFAIHVSDAISDAHDGILNTKGKPKGIAYLDDKGFIPLKQLGNLDMTFFEVVTELPTKDIKKHIYLIKNNKEGEQDTYDEYLYTGDVDGEYDASKWEKLGDFVPTFDLKEYAKKGEGVLTLKMSQTATDGCKIVLDMADGNSKETEIPLASAEILFEEELSTRTAKPWSPTILFKNGLMSGSDKHKLDQIDTEALSQSISSANTAADNTKDAIRKCESATAGAEKVNARLDGNVLTVTNRKGEEQSVNLTDTDEHVTVNLTTKVSDVATEGLVLFVYINNGADLQEYIADSNGQVVFTVEKGATYRIVFPALKGCNPINPIQHIAAVGSRIIDAEYVAETERVEHVTVKVKKADDKDVLAPWERFNVYVTVNNVQTTYTTDEEGKVEFDVKNGTSYKVAVDEQDGMYEQYGRYSITRTAIADSYRFNFTYRTYESGIWLIDDENNRYTYDEWAESGNDAQKLMFVCIKTLSTQRYNGDIYIGLDAMRDFSKMAATKTWCNQNVAFNNIPLNGRDSNNSAWSRFAYNGLLSTETIIAEGDERELSTPACDYAYGFKLTNGDLEYQGYLPTSYQWETAWQSIDYVLDCLALKFPNETFMKSMFSGTKWTSTQFSAAFSYDIGTSVNTNYKFNSYLAIPFFACLSPS